MGSVPITNYLTFHDAFVRVQIIGWSDDYQPGLVECSLIDRFGREWRMIERVPRASSGDLRPDSIYPQPGRIACDVLSNGMDDEGRETRAIKIALGGMQADHFEVFADQLVAFTPEDFA